MIKIRKSQLQSLGFDLEAALTAYGAALDAHKYTVDQPAPMAHPLVEQIWRAGGYELEDDPIPQKPEPKPERYAYSKAAMFMEMTDEEFDRFDQVKAKQSPRERAIFDNATEIDEDHPLFPKLKVLLKMTYGDKRGFDILAAGRFQKQ